MNDLRYDGPDLEADTNSRAQGTLMAGVMIAEAAQQGRQARAERIETARLEQDRTLWRDTPPGKELADLGDEALAARWQACARHHGDSEANQTRGRVESELAVRDPETMRDYRSWRNAAGMPPAQAMQQALAEREARLAERYRPLTGPGANALDTQQLLDGWAAAHGAHGTNDDVARAQAKGEELLRQREPELMAPYDALRGTNQTDARLRITDAEAAARTAGGRAAFGPAGWSALRTGAAGQSFMAARTAAPAAGPAGAAAAAVATTVHRLIRKGQQM